MSQPGFPGHHTTSTVYSSTQVTSIRWDPSYIQTLPGVLKIVQIVSKIIFIIKFFFVTGARGLKKKRLTGTFSY